MNDEHENDLRERFARQRRCDHENAPAWRAELLHAPVRRPHGASWRWIPLSLATACVALAALLISHRPGTEPSLSNLPPLFDSRDGELFAGLDPAFPAFEAPSDFLLPTHLNLHLP